MRECTVMRGLEIVEGDGGDWEALKRFHYRDGKLVAWDRIFAIRPGIGVIVYTMPAAALELRNFATGRCFCGFDRRTNLELVNKNVRCIGRVVIEPRYRGLGLARRLVSETVGRMDVPVVESMAVMGHVNPFFEKAGMTPYVAPVTVSVKRLMEVLSIVGIEEDEFVDPELVEKKIERLEDSGRDFVEREIQRFLAGHGRKRFMGAGLLRTRYVLSRLTERPVYYAWFNGDMGIVTE